MDIQAINKSSYDYYLKNGGRGYIMFPTEFTDKNELVNGKYVEDITSNDMNYFIKTYGNAAWAKSVINIFEDIQFRRRIDKLKHLKNNING